MGDIFEHPLTDYLWREYEWIIDGHYAPRIYRIEHPVKLFTRDDGTMHRILDAAGIVHILPAPGHFGCVVRYKKKDGVEPVTF